MNLIRLTEKALNLTAIIIRLIAEALIGLFPGEDRPLKLGHLVLAGFQGQAQQVPSRGGIGKRAELSKSNRLMGAWTRVGVDPYREVERTTGDVFLRCHRSLWLAGTEPWSLIGALNRRRPQGGEQAPHP